MFNKAFWLGMIYEKYFLALYPTWIAFSNLMSRRTNQHAQATISPYFRLLYFYSVSITTQADTLNFDDLDNFSEVPSGYGGLEWSNLYALDSSTYYFS